MNELQQMQTVDAAISDADLDAFASRLESLPLDDAVWVATLLVECRRARAAEASLRGAVDGASSDALQVVAEDVAQVVLDAAEWLKTLWNVGYMGAGHFQTAPRSEFPEVEVEDVLKSALLQRIRSGRRPLPFPPPTKQGMPWHEVVEGEDQFIVDAALIRDEAGALLGVSIEACTDWSICERRSGDAELVVQHQGKGPRYLLMLDPMFSRLQRLPPQWTRRILARERASFRTYFLEWPEEGKASPRLVSLRAVSWERAEAEAQYWVATHAPTMYGQIRFEEASG